MTFAGGEDLSQKAETEEKEQLEGGEKKEKVRLSVWHALLKHDSGPETCCRVLELEFVWTMV